MINNEPKIRNVNKAHAPYELNKFPNEFIYILGQELVYLMATKPVYSLEGNEWEQIFATCIGAEWKPSNVGLDDVVLENCCWGAKTVKTSNKSIISQHKVRLISGRNSPVYSYEAQDYLSQDPNNIGAMVLNIWNERVSSVRKIFKFVRTVVLIKGKDFDEFGVFEFDTIRYEPELYYWKWNQKSNLEGFNKNDEHCFTWQPHGSQFTVVEKVPEDIIIFKLKKPRTLNKNYVLETVNYSNEWIQIIKDGRRI